MNGFFYCNICINKKIIMYICLNVLISIFKFYDKDNLYEVEENLLDDWWFVIDF